MQRGEKKHYIWNEDVRLELSGRRDWNSPEGGKGSGGDPGLLTAGVTYLICQNPQLNQQNEDLTRLAVPYKARSRLPHLPGIG